MISDKLINKTLVYFKKFENEDIVVSPSLPILYFGNLNEYEDSKFKVLTVGKNPSDNEFRLNKKEMFSFIRFPQWNKERENLKEALNSYFEEKPLKQWFSSFEPILNGMSCSYYNGVHDNIALHTDICSPLATTPTWSKLTNEQKNLLYEEGIEIWKELIEELQPDLMLISVPQNLFQKIVITSGKELISFDIKKDGELRKKVYRVDYHAYKLNNGKNVKVVFGLAANKPFDTITQEQKNKIGEICLK